MARKLVVEIVGDASSLERAFGRSSKSAKKFNDNLTTSVRRTQGIFRGLSGAAATVGLAFGTAGIVAGIKRATDAASSLNEETNKSQVVFGRASQATLAWSKTTADGYGIAASAALGAASNFGLLFRTIGAGQATTAQMSQDFVELAGDLASFFNVDTATALEKLRSGLAGEAEPLRQFGVFIDEAKVKAEAYRSGIARAGAVLTQAQKIQARYNIIMRETGPAHGDAARTAEGWANVQRRLAAVIQDLSARIGTSLLPVLARYGDRLADWLADSRNQKRVTDFVADAVDKLTVAVRTGAKVVRFMVDEWREFTGIVRGVRNTVQAVIDEFRRVALFVKQTGIRMALDFVEPFSHLPVRFGGWARDMKEELLKNMAGIEQEMAGIGEKSGDAFGESLKKPVAEHAAEIPQRLTLPRLPAAERAAPKGFSAEQRNRWFDAMIGRKEDRVQDIASLQGQLRALEQINTLVRQRLAKTKDITRQLSLVDKIVGIQRQQRAIQEQIAQNRAAHLQRMRALKEQRAQVARELAERQALARETKQFRALGLGAGGEELAPSAQSLRKRLGRVSEAVRGTFLDTSKTRSVLAGIRKVLSGGLGKVSKAVREQIEQILAGLDTRLEETTKKLKDATEQSVTKIGALQMFADLRKFGGNVWSRTGGMPTATPAGGGAPVTVNQYFQAPTTDRHREARYARVAARAAFDS